MTMIPSGVEIGHVYKGLTFNELVKEPLFKLTNAAENHNGFQYQDGLNIDEIPFNPTGECQKGGLYFATLENIWDFLCYGANLREVTIPDDVQVYVEEYKFKADKIFFGKNWKLDEYFTNHHEQIRLTY